ncbi:hypothetical protein HBB16_11470 [Pseudonocardia sp. MCCB 268]|nr:hypothetical protein [Pseudonocardia cytotoxica]
MLSIPFVVVCLTPTYVAGDGRIVRWRTVTRPDGSRGPGEGGNCRVSAASAAAVPVTVQRGGEGCVSRRRDNRFATVWSRTIRGRRPGERVGGDCPDQRGLGDEADRQEAAAKVPSQLPISHTPGASGSKTTAVPCRGDGRENDVTIHEPPDLAGGSEPMPRPEGASSGYRGSARRAGRRTGKAAWSAPTSARSVTEASVGRSVHGQVGEQVRGEQGTAALRWSANHRYGTSIEAVR